MTVWRGKAVYSVDEACAMLHLDQPTLHRLVRIGELGACCLEDRIAFQPQHLKEYQRRSGEPTPGN